MNATLCLETPASLEFVGSLGVLVLLLTRSGVGHPVAGGAWLAPVVAHMQEPVPPPLSETTKNALPDASKINYGIKIALFKSFILRY